MEIWKDIVGTNGLYQVSNYGRIKSIGSKCTSKKYYESQRKVKILKPYVGKTGYCSTAIRLDGKTKRMYIHRVVAKHFIDNPKNYGEVNHLDGNKGNNRHDNLEWSNRKLNLKHAFKTGLKKPVPKKGIPRNKLSREDVLTIRKLQGILSTIKIAKAFDVNSSTISAILNRKLWSKI